MDQDFLLWILAGVAGLTVFSLAFALVGDGKGAKRVAKVRDRSRGLSEVPEEVILRLDQRKQTGLDGIVKRFLPRPELLRLRLLRTGHSIGLGTYAIICGGTVAVCLGALLFFSVPPALALPGGIILGLVVPHIGVAFLAARRAKKFTALFPEAIGLMVRGIKSGLPIGETMIVVGQEVPDPVGEEFRRVADQVRLGQSLENALWETAKRIGTPEIKFLVVSLSVQKETGGNLAETLENLDTILRRRRQMKLKIKAMSSE
ncbi:MAG: type II secretion system F family protein, partial [Roseiarcus sp.]